MLGPPSRARASAANSAFVTEVLTMPATALARAIRDRTVGSREVVDVHIARAHLPSVHHGGMEIAEIPLWVPAVLALVGVAYWAAILRTEGRVALKVRRAALLGAQELAAFVGLLAIFGAWAPMDDESPLGISPTWDQRLGGLLMMATCAAVAIPIARRLAQPARAEVNGGAAGG